MREGSTREGRGVSRHANLSDPLAILDYAERRGVYFYGEEVILRFFGPPSICS